MKYIISFICTLILLINSAFASTVIRSGSCGTGCSYTEDSDGLVTITGNGNGVMTIRDYNRSPWYRNSTAKKVIIDGVQNIAQFAFNETSSIKEVIIGKSVTRIDTDGLTDMRGLESVTIQGNLISFGKGSLAFNNKLKELIISDTTMLTKDAFCTNWSNSWNADNYMKTVTIKCAGELEKCKQNLALKGIENSFANIIQTSYKKENSDGTISYFNQDGILSYIENENGSLLTTYKYDEDGRYRTYDANGKLTGEYNADGSRFYRRIYTVNEATSAVSGKGKNTFKLKYR